MSDLPRLLLCSYDVIPGPAGLSRRLTEYLKALPDRFNVVVLSAKTPDHSHIEKYQGARLLRVPVGSGDLASRIQAFERAVRRQLESEEYALVHFTDPFGGYALCELKGDYGYRLVYEAQAFPSMEMPFTHPQTGADKRLLAKIRRQELFCLMSSDRVITGSDTTKSYIQSLGAAEDSVRVVRAPVNLEPYAPEALGVPDGSPMRLMYLGSQVGWQGLNTLLRGMALAAQQVDVRLTLVGPRHPDWQPHLEELVKELGLQGRVEFQPPVGHDDVAKVLALADVGVLPLDAVERNQQQGGSLSKASEYFAAARPVLASDLPVTRELLPSSATVFFPAGDVPALAQRIVELARDVPRRVELGRQGRAFAQEHLDAGVVRGRLLDIYDELLGKAPATGPAPLQPATTTVTGTPTNRIAQMAPPGGAPSEPAPAPAPAAAAPAPASPPPAAPAPVVPRDELPLLLGRVLDEGLDDRLIKTEPDARPNEPPVVMGLPLREAPAAVDAQAAAATILTSSPLSEARPAPPPARAPLSPSNGPAAPAPSVRGLMPPREPPPVRIPQVAKQEPSTLASSARASTAVREDTPSRTPPVLPKQEPPAPASAPPVLPKQELPAPAARPSTDSLWDDFPVPRPPPRPAAASMLDDLLGPAPAPRPSPAPPPVASPARAAPEPVLQGMPLQDGPPVRLPTARPESSEAAPAPGVAMRLPTARPTVSEPPEAPASGVAMRVSTASRIAAPPRLEPAPGPARPSSASIPLPPPLPPVTAQRIPSAPSFPSPARPAPAEPRVPARGGPPTVLEMPAPGGAHEEDIPELDAEELAEGEAAPSPGAQGDGLVELSGDEVLEAEAAADEPATPELPGSALDTWFVQLAHGYCPPEGVRFTRHAPPTNFPGREPDADPSRGPQAPRARGKAS